MDTQDIKAIEEADARRAKATIDKDTATLQTLLGDERLYVHGSGFEGGVRLQGPCGGILVEFTIGEGPDSRHAEGVRVVPDVAPRRARRHRGH